MFGQGFNLIVSDDFKRTFQEMPISNALNAYHISQKFQK